MERNQPQEVDHAATHAGTAPGVGLLNNVPKELRDRPQWLLAGPNGKGELKVPITIDEHGQPAPGSSTDPSTWLTFPYAAAYAAELGLGLGYVLAAEDPYTCIDLDVKPTTPAEHIERQRAIFHAFASYTEISQSGKGAHIWCLGNIGKGRKRDGVEVYSQERFIACTGRSVHTPPLPIVDRQEMLGNMVTKMPRPDDEGPLPDLAERLADAQVWAATRAQMGDDLFDAVCRGDYVTAGKPSGSELDAKLLEAMMFVGASDEQCRRLYVMTDLAGRVREGDRAPHMLKDDRLLNKALKYARRQWAARQAEQAMAQAHGAQVAAGLHQAAQAAPGASQTAGPVLGQPGSPAAAPAGVWVNGDFWPAPIALPPRTLVTRTADTVALEAMAWLWPGFLACKFLNLVVGETSAGKSTVIADIAARITTGRPWPGEPDGTAPRQRGRVLWLGSEDPMGLLTVPRLMACGADLHMVTEIQGVSRGGDARTTFSMQDDLAAVRAELAQARAAGWPFAMLVIDPITSYLSGGKLRKVDMNDSGQLRTILEPWTVLAEETGIAIVGVTHLAKDTTRSLLHRVLGGGAFAQLCRSLIAVVNRPDDGGPYAKAMLQVKSNLPDAQRGAWRFNTEQKVAGHTSHGQPVQANFPVWDYFDRALSPEELAGGTRGPVARKPSAFRLWLQAQFVNLQADEWLAVEGVRAQAINDGVCTSTWWKEQSGTHMEKRNLRGIWECRPKAGEAN